MILLAARFGASVFNLNAAQRLVQTRLSRIDRTAGRRGFLQCSNTIFKINYIHSEADGRITECGLNKLKWADVICLK